MFHHWTEERRLSGTWNATGGPTIPWSRSEVFRGVVTLSSLVRLTGLFTVEYVDTADIGPMSQEWKQVDTLGGWPRELHMTGTVRAKFLPWLALT